MSCLWFQKGHLTQLVDIILPEKPHDTWNLWKDLHLKVGVCVMITTNIDVADGLTNVAMGSVTILIPDEKTGHILAVFMIFDHDTIGQDAWRKSIYKHVNKNAVPIVQIQVSFPVKGESLQAMRTQFPLTLCWDFTIHKCQGLTLPEIVVDMLPSKGTFPPGQAYVAFSRVTQLEKLHIVNYNCAQIKVSPHIADEMKRLCTNCVPQLQHNLFKIVKSDVNIVHINVGNIYRKIDDIKQDAIL